MVISLQGLWHCNVNLNNQDCIFKNDKMILVLDGCTQATYSDAGTRLFIQYFKSLKDFDNVDMFEENVNNVFEKIVKQGKEWFDEEKLKEYLQENFLFTILACFKKDNDFIVKVFGDGYIVTQNYNNRVSYIALSYGDMTEKGKLPPYFAYKYCDVELDCIDEFKFKTFIFNTSKFKKVGVATDGIKPIAMGHLKDFNSCIINGYIDEEIMYLLQKHRNLFDDDCTIGLLNNGGVK